MVMNKTGYEEKEKKCQWVFFLSGPNISVWGPKTGTFRWVNSDLKIPATAGEGREEGLFVKIQKKGL